MSSVVIKIFIIIFIFLSLQRVEALPKVFGGKLGYGSASFGDGDSIPLRNLSAIPLSVFGGLRWRVVQAGFNLSYTQQAQNVELTSVDDQNASGTVLTLGPQVQWFNRKWGLALEYKLLSTYTFSQTDANGASVRYSGSGYSINIMRNIRKRLGIYFEYSVESFNKTNDQPLEPNVGNARYSIGLLYSNFWK